MDILVDHGLGCTFALEEIEVDIVLGKKDSSSVALDKVSGTELRVLEELRGLNLAELSPMMAFNRVCEWNSMLKNEKKM